jgi:hypothetical protein
LRRRLPRATQWLEHHPARARLERLLDWFVRRTGVAAPTPK